MTTLSTIIVLALILVGTVLYVRLWLHYRRNIRKVAFMFDAIDNVDFSFNFSTRHIGHDEKLLNQSLNRIKLFLEHARDEAVAQEKYYEQIMDAAGTALLVVDDLGHILQHNKAATTLLQRETLTHIDQVKERLNDGSLALRETYTTLRGSRVRIIALSDINGELANREVDSWIKLIRVLTHEIMNTITPITSLSETLLKHAEGEQREGLETINRTGSELITFVENYRRFTHVPQPQPKLFYVKPFIERMAHLASHPVTVNVMPADLLAYADEGLMGRVVTNLLKNAGEAIDAQEVDTTAADVLPQIWVNAYTGDDDSVVIDVCNNAGLIDADVAQHIFVPFFTTKNNGSGVGLPLSRQIMRVSGGTLQLIQDAQKGVVTFRMKL